MFGFRVPFNRDAIEHEWWGICFIDFVGKYNFNGLFGNIWVKQHFPLVSPFCDFFQVPIQFLRRKLINYMEYEGVVCKDVNVRLNHFDEVIYIHKE